MALSKQFRNSFELNIQIKSYQLLINNSGWNEKGETIQFTVEKHNEKNEEKKLVTRMPMEFVNVSFHESHM